MKKHFLKRLGAAALFIVGASTALAQTPPVRLLVGFPAGGAPDAVARAFAESLRTIDGTSIIVENKPGAAGLLAIESLLSSPADGTTIALIPSSAALLVPMVNKNARYDALKDLKPLGSVAEYGFGVAAGPLANVTDMSGLKAWVAKNTKDASFASPGVGTPQHLMGAELGSLMGTQLLHVPYRGGASAMSDLLGGQIPVLITTAQLLVPLHQQGKLATLFVTTQNRHPQMPDVPTAAEVGLDQLTVQDWFGLFAASGLSQKDVDMWQSRIQRVTQTASYRDTLVKMGYVLPSQSVDVLPGLMAADYERWERRAKLAGVQ